MKTSLGNTGKLFRSSIATAQLLIIMLMVGLSFSSTKNSYAEGTKQLEPLSETPTLQLLFYSLNYSGLSGYRNPFGVPGCAPEYRLNIRINNPATETVCFGFRDANNSESLYFQVRDPNGNIARPWSLVPVSASAGTPGYIDTWTEAYNGPELSGPGPGYTPLTMVPAMAGDYYVEFAPNASGGAFTSTTGHLLRFFDISVVQSTSLINGRVWSKAWQLADGSSSASPASSFYIYSDDGFVSKVNMNGWDGAQYYLNSNATGVTITFNWINDRKSVEYSGNFDDQPQYKEFLNEPDITVFPSGSLGQICEAITTPLDCNSLFYFLIKANRSGYIRMHISSSQGNEDKVKYIVGNPACNTFDSVYWNKTIAGTPVVNGTEVTVTFEFLNGLTNLLCDDIETCYQGMQVDFIRPVAGNLGVMWDDSQLFQGTVNSSFPGCVYATSPPNSGCHAFANGNSRVMNTWWYQPASYPGSLTFTLITKPAYPVTAPVGPSLVCSGQPATYTIPAILSAESYLWYLPDGSTQSTPTNTITLSFPNGSPGGYLRVAGVNSSCGTGPNSPALQITVQAVPSLPITGNQTPCPGVPQTYTTTPGLSSYQWSVTGGTTSAGSSPNEVIVVWNTSGANSITVAGTVAVCGQIMNTYTVNVQPSPVPTLSGLQSVCPSAEGVLYQTESGMANYTWPVSGGNVVSGGGMSDDHVMVVWSVPGTGTVSVNYQNGAGCMGLTPTSSSITIGNCKTLNVKMYLESLYAGSGLMNQASDYGSPHFGAGIADKVRLELHSATNYADIVLVKDNLNLSTSGNVTVSVPGSYSGSYYITVHHRNHVTTTTAIPVSFSGSTVIYDFTIAASKAYGNNMQNMGGVYAIYGGDVNQDGLVESTDMIEIDNSVITWATGYLPVDANGDGVVDSSDMILVDNNAAAFVGAVLPPTQ